MVRLLFLLCFVFLFWPESGYSADAGADYLPVDRVQRGMKGIGRTVFQGTKIDTFQVEVLGVLRNVFGPKSDMILARLSGGPLAETGVIAGMSGSPVYVDGKLVGAVGYSIGAFSKEPIAGITPIGEMIDVMKRSPEAFEDALGADDGFWGGAQRAVAVAEMEAGEIRPVAVPLVMSGFAPQVLAELREALQPLGLLPVQGGGGTDLSLPAGAFEPGAALGVQLIRGDFSVTGIGTLTYREEDRVVGFGHPMLYGGSTALPMTAAYIHQVLPSQYLSFKLGAASQPMGVIVQDRAPGIAGFVGRSPAMLPTRIEVRSPDNREVFQMEVLRHREFGPLLVRAAVTSALISAEKLMGATTVRVRSRIRLTGRPDLETEDVYAGPMGLGEAVLGATQPLVRLVQNPFEPVRVEEVVFELDVEERVRAAQVEAIRLEKAHFQPGDTLRVTVDLLPYLGESEPVDAQLRIPDRARSGRLILRVSSARVYKARESKRAPGEYAPRDLDHLIRLLGREERNDELIVELLSMDPGVTVEGREVTSLPPSVLAALKLSRKSGAVRRVAQTVLEQRKIRTPYVLSGGQTVYIIVNREQDGLVFEGKPEPEDERK